MKQYQNFINGEWVPAASGDTFTNHNPADTREAVAEYAKGGTCLLYTSPSPRDRG